MHISPDRPQEAWKRSFPLAVIIITMLKLNRLLKRVSSPYQRGLNQLEGLATVLQSPGCRLQRVTPDLDETQGRIMRSLRLRSNPKR